MPPPVIHIRRRRGLLDIDWAELWHYRDLLVQMVARDFSARYKQTVLGPLWFIIQPLATTLIFTVVFSGIAKISTDGLPPTLFYLTGLLAWNYFSTALNSISGCLRANAGIVSKVYFPRLILPLVGACSALLGLVVQIATWAVVLIVIKSSMAGTATFGLTIHLWAFPLLILQAGVLAVGVGLILTTLTAKYRDLSYAMGFVTQAWLYATPIIYPLSQIPERWQWVAALNPMTAVVETTRFILLGQGSPNPIMIVSSVAITLVVLFAGLLVFNRIERHFVDII